MVKMTTRPWLSVAAGLLLLSCKPPQDEPGPQPVEAQAPALPTLPAPLPTVSRKEFLAAMSQAAEAAALGNGPPKSAIDLAGRRLSLKLPFGCFGPNSNGGLGYSFDSAKGALKVTVKSQDWTADPKLHALLGNQDAEAIEGFWIPRPWLTTDACPAWAPNLDFVQAPQLIGLAQVFGKDSSRVMRRSGRPYEVSRKVDAAPAGGFVLVLEGRLIAGQDGSAIACRRETTEQQPLCLGRVEFDRVAIEGRDGSAFGEWRS